MGSYSHLRADLPTSYCLSIDDGTPTPHLRCGRCSKRRSKELPKLPQRPGRVMPLPRKPQDVACEPLKETLSIHFVAVEWIFQQVFRVRMRTKIGMNAHLSHQAKGYLKAARVVFCLCITLQRTARATASEFPISHRLHLPNLGRVKENSLVITKA